MKPQIIIEDYSHKGYHNTHSESIARLEKGGQYRDLSTVCIIPSRGMIHAKVVQNWMMLMPAMNQQFIRIFAIGLEVGEAYNKTIEMILDHPSLSKFKYILTLEDDCMPPPDGLLKLYENIEEYDVIGGLYWTKGEEGQPMIYGNPKDEEFNFRPQVPLLDSIQESNGLGMGFNLFKLDIFKDKRIEKPWFKTLQEFDYIQGGKSYTQDLFFYQKLKNLDYKVACDTRVKIGHLDVDSGIIW